MKKYILSFTTILLALLVISCGKKPLTDDYGCFADYDEAITHAGKKNQPILIFFTSQGDDDQSTLLVTDVLKNASFKEKILSKYTVMHADFSQNAFQKTVAPDNSTAEEQKLANTYTTIMQNNYQLAVLFNVSQMPAVFLCTKDGYVVNRLDDSNGFSSFDDFENELDSNSSELDHFNNLVVQTGKGTALKKVEAIDTLYIATQPEYRSFLLPLVKYAVELDKNNESGLCGKFILAQAEAEAMSAYSQGDVETAVQKYLTAANNEFVRAEEKQECFFTAAYLVAYSDTDDYEGIISYLKTAYELAPESSKAQAIQDAITYFETVLEKTGQRSAE